MMVSISLYAHTHLHGGTIEGALRIRTATDILKAEKLQTLITAAKIVDVEPIWTTLFAKVRTICWGRFGGITITDIME